MASVAIHAALGEESVTDDLFKILGDLAGDVEFLDLSIDKESGDAGAVCRSSG